MSQNFPADPMNRYNFHSYRTILKGLQPQSADQAEILKVLSEMLVFANESLLSDFPMNDMCKGLTHLASTSQSDEIVLLSSQCIYSLLEAHHAALKTFSRYRLIPVLNTRLSTIQNVSTIEHILQVLSFFATRNPEIIGEILGIQIFLTAFPKISKIEQRSCILSVATITENYVTERFGESLKDLVTIIANPDNLIRQHASTAFTLITNSISSQSIPKSVYLPMIELLYTTTDSNIAVIFARLLYMATKDRSAIRILNSQTPDFNRLMFSPCAREMPEICGQLLKMAQNLMPPPNLPKSLWSIKNRSYPNSQELIIHLEDVLLKFLNERPECEQTAIATLAGCASIIQMKPTPDLLNILLRLSKTAQKAPYVLAVAINLTSKNEAMRSGLFEILKKNSVDSDHKEWYKGKLKAYSTESNAQSAHTIPASVAFAQTLDAVISYINEESIMPYEFLHTNLIDKCTTIIRAGATNGSDISILIKLAYGILSFEQFPRIHENLRVTSIFHFTKKTFPVNFFSSRGQIRDFNLSVMSDFMTIEGWFNIEYNSRVITRLQECLRSKTPLTRMIEGQPEDITDDPLRFALLCRAFELKKYCYCSFKCRNFVFSAYDNVSHALAVLCPTPKSLSQMRLDIHIVENDAPRADFFVPAFESEGMKKALDFLTLIHTKVPSQFKANPLFSQQILTRMTSPLITMFHYDPTVRLMFQYPFLFPFKDRTFIFRVVCLDPNIGVKELHRRLFAGSEEGATSLLHLHCKVDRSQLFSDGSLLMKRLGGGRFLTEFTFANEIGFGDGPTQEFFALLSRCYCLNEYKMWRNDSYDDNNSSNNNNNTSNNNNNTLENNNNNNTLENNNNNNTLENNNNNNNNNNFRNNINYKDNYNYNDVNDASKYSWTDGGLFPQPSVDGSLLEELGALCSKAIIMQKIIDIPFNPAFFKMVMGYQVTVADIDPIFARSLECKEGLYGLTFQYPTKETFELKPNGKNIYVDENNVNEYVNLVNDFTCGKKMLEKIKFFIDGFEKNIPRGALRLFTPEEVASLVSGEEVKMTIRDLRESVKLEHGYFNGSPEIEMFFDIIINMTSEEKKLLIKFITGCERLPIGGLSSLEPKFTIAKRISNTSDKPDNCLPSVMTCTNYFKMPPYSNREVMRKKVMQAIYECQDTFQLS